MLPLRVKHLAEFFVMPILAQQDLSRIFFFVFNW